MNLLRRLLRDWFESLALHFSTTERSSGRLILAYHNIVPTRSTALGDRSLHIPLDQFRTHLEILKDSVNIVSLWELLRGDELAGPSVAITFDDAYYSALNIGVPLCASFDIPCTVFISPNLLGEIPVWDRLAEKGRWSTEERAHFLWQSAGIQDRRQALEQLQTVRGALLRIATREELQIAATLPGVTFGAHTMNHANLAALNPESASKEIWDSASWIKEHFPNSFVPVLAYPYGLQPANSTAVALEGHIEYALLVSGGWMHTALQYSACEIPRLNIPEGLSANGFRLRLRQHR